MGESAMKFKVKRASWWRYNLWKSNAFGYFDRTGCCWGRRDGPIRVRPNYKIKVGDDWGWVDVGQVGQFQNGRWYVNVRDVWQATHNRSRPFDSRRGEVYPHDWFVR